MISLDNLKTTINAIKCLLTDYPKKKDIPTKLPNPNPLTFTGAVTSSYDGSAPLSVEIPSGGGSAVELDTTLSEAGKAADAKAVGNALTGKQDKITSTNKLAYSLISGTPTIPTVPTNVSAFTNDAGYLTLATLPKYEGETQ